MRAPALISWKEKVTEVGFVETVCAAFGLSAIRYLVIIAVVVVGEVSKAKGGGGGGINIRFLPGTNYFFLFGDFGQSR